MKNSETMMIRTTIAVLALAAWTSSPPVWAADQIPAASRDGARKILDASGVKGRK